MRWSRAATALLVVVAIGGGCTSNTEPALGDARTYYESLDLDSPLEGAQTFVKAFARDDFMTVYLVLDSAAQFAIHQHVNLIDYDALLDTSAVPDIDREMASLLSLDESETTDMWHLFDRLMMLAARNDAFLIDLGGEVSFDDEDDTSEVIATVAGIAGEVIFRMTESPSGRWRVHQIVTPGGDTNTIPWSARRAPSP